MFNPGQAISQNTHEVARVALSGRTSIEFTGLKCIAKMLHDYTN